MDPEARAYIGQIQQQVNALAASLRPATAHAARPSGLHMEVLRLYARAPDKAGAPQVGKYLARIVQGESTERFTGALTLPTGMKVTPADSPCLALALADIDSNASSMCPTLLKPIYVIGARVGRTDSTNRPAGDAKIPIYVIVGGLPSGDVWVRITGDGGYGGGKYAGKIIQPPAADLATAGTLAASDFGTDDADAIILNAQEIGSNTHWLTAAGNTNQKTFVGRVLRYQADGKAVVGINGLWAKTCA